MKRIVYFEKNYYYMRKVYGLWMVLALFFLFSSPLWSQETTTVSGNRIKINYNDSVYGGLKWRCIGPFRGGRCLAVTGVPANQLTYYAGAVGGGVWKTIDGGSTWNSISDTSFHTSSVGALAVSLSNPNIVYAGMGEVEMRGNISIGDGVYKSTDAGVTWKHMGLT